MHRQAKALSDGDRVCYWHRRTEGRATNPHTRTKSNSPRFVEMNSEVRDILLPLCKGRRPDDHVWLFPKTAKPFDDIKKRLSGLCEDAGIERLVWHDLQATYGTVRQTRLKRHDIARLMGHTDISTSQRYVRNLAQVRQSC
jgi:integrase